MRAVVKAAPGRPSTFNRDDIVECALALLDRGGVKALSLRGVARELGCVLGTINYHFDNLADLEDAVTAHLLKRMPVLDAARPEPLREQLLELALAQIEAHSTHPYLRHVAGPVSIEIAARQLRQNWGTLQALGLPEHLAMLCMEVLSGLAHNRGTEIYRLRNGGEQALRLHREFLRKLDKAPPAELTMTGLSVESLEPFHRAMISNAIDTFLRGAGTGVPAKTRAAVRRAP